MSWHDKEMRAVYAETLIELMKQNKNVVCLEADLGKATGTFPIVRDTFPDNFFDVGVAEANMVGVAAGMANEGKIPFAASFTCFASRRVYDQATISAAYANNPVQIVGTAPGVTATFNGGTHMCFQDLAIMRAMPNMRVFSPADACELRAVMKYMVQDPKPTYLQLIREKMAPIFDDSCTFSPDKAVVLSQGTDVTLVTTGFATQTAFAAKAELAAAGLSVEHIHYASVKPFDAATLVASVKKTGAVVTVENQNVLGGLGGAVCEVLAEQYPAPVKRLGALDRFGEVGPLEYLIDAIGIGTKDIVAACKAMKK